MFRIPHTPAAVPRRTPRLWAPFAALLLAASVLFAVPPSAAHAAGLHEVTGFGSNPGNLRMFAYVPDGLPAGRPVVVALHGCTQSAAAYDDETGWTQLADELQFALLLPQQRSANNSNSCFNWFQSGDISRGQGEALSIAQMLDRVQSDQGSDPQRAYVTGLSVGGAMTAVMLAAYPDRFAGGAVVAGLPYKCATSVLQAFSCMNPGVDKSPQQWGDLVRGASSYDGPWPVVSLWQGTSDTTVDPSNLTELVEQWTNVHGTDATPEVSDTVAGYPHHVYDDGSGQPVVEDFRITGMGHGQPVDPGSGPGQCGSTAPYILDVDICAARHIAAFWGLSAGGDGGDPGGDPDPGSGTAVFRGDDAHDGYVKAAADGSGASVGTLESSYGLAIGRGADGRLNRTVLSFDTSALPDDATVTGAHLTVRRSYGSGDPWNDPAGNRLLVDVRRGCFGGSCTVGPDDWAAAPTAAAAAAVPRLMSGTADSSDFASAGLAAVNPTGTTQVKLRFAQDPAATGYLFVEPGAAATLT
ncbi:MAG TPA: PHB depolymerase family esterase, partial [Streptomyces sp.]|nr:PHB depolymerase family esterase [Streptomyces sp.]